MKITIKNRWDGSTLYEGEHDSLASALIIAIRSRADLTDARLTGADLTDADLTAARLTRARLTRARLTRARLTGADLTDADLTGADLTGADLTPIRNDLYEILALAPLETPTLREALVAGLVDGTVYDGDCACLVGTIAKARECDVDDIAECDGLGKIVKDSNRLAERWFLAIRPGMAADHPVAALTIGWIDAWLEGCAVKS